MNHEPLREEFEKGWGWRVLCRCGFVTPYTREREQALDHYENHREGKEGKQQLATQTQNTKSRTGRWFI